MHSFTNPAFRPTFVSRIPKPAPIQPPRDLPPPLQELPSTSHMQMGPRPEVLPAGHPAQELTLHAPERQPAPGTDQLSIDQAKLQEAGEATGLQSIDPVRLLQLQHHDQQRAPGQLFARPGHDILAVISGEEGPSQQQQAAAADPVGGPSQISRDATGAQEQSMGSLEALDGDGTHFGDLCRRLVAVIEVPLLPWNCCFGLAVVLDASHAMAQTFTLPFHSVYKVTMAQLRFAVVSAPCCGCFW